MPLELEPRLQQGWPALPQGMHVVPASEQVVPLAVQMRPLQQGCPAAPQPPHEPSAPQVAAALTQLCPTPTQNAVDPKSSATQQPPSAQRLPPQQGTRVPGGLALPHFTQRASLLNPAHTVSAPLQRVVPGQHSSPGPPQVWQTPSPVLLLCRQNTPLSVQRCPGQQGAPRPPHLMQVPAVPKRPELQALSASVQRVSSVEGLLVFAGQQGSFRRPQPQRPPVHMPNDISLTPPTATRQTSPAALH
jgi:hypothetical protein